MFRKLSVLAIVPISFLASCKDSESSKCEEIDTAEFIGHIDYASGEWWDTDTGELIGYSLSEDSPVFASQACQQ